MLDCINRFSGKNFIFSNFYPRDMEWGGVIFKSNEHFYNAYKTEIPEEFYEIVAAPTAAAAKKFGRKAKLREDWELGFKDRIMIAGLKLKFKIPDIRQYLVDSSPKILIEGNTWHDNYWGDCSCLKCRNVEGRNKLGRMLMDLRDQIMNNKLVYRVDLTYACGGIETQNGKVVGGAPSFTRGKNSWTIGKNIYDVLTYWNKSGVLKDWSQISFY